MYEIIKKELIAPNTYSMNINAPRIAKSANPGQFVIIITHDEGERIPLTIADSNKNEGWVRIIYQVVGLGTTLMAEKNVGESFYSVAGPLGRPSNLAHIKNALCIGGGIGTAVVYPIVKKLFEDGVNVDVIAGSRNKELVILEEDIRANCNNLYITTDDGSYGTKGFVTDMLKKLIDSGKKYDEVIAIGPPIMMKFVSLATKPYGIKTIVSLNPVMVDGTGMCGGCRVTVGGETKYACVDGPEFDGHLVDFDEMMKRSAAYNDQEREAMENHKCRGGLFSDK